MTLELSDPSKTYDLAHPSGAKFRLRYWTPAMQEEVDKRCVSVDPGGKISYSVSLEREIKIEHCLIGWEGVTLGGSEVECGSETKKLVPPGVRLWLIEDIDRKAGFRMGEEEKKN